VLIGWDFEGHDHPVRGRLDIHVVWGLAIEQLIAVVLVVWAVGRERQVLHGWAGGRTREFAGVNGDVIVCWVSGLR
jgi:hypothetical protein